MTSNARETLPVISCSYEMAIGEEMEFTSATNFFDSLEHCKKKWPLGDGLNDTYAYFAAEKSDGRWVDLACRYSKESPYWDMRYDQVVFRWNKPSLPHGLIEPKSEKSLSATNSASNVAIANSDSVAQHAGTPMTPASERLRSPPVLRQDGRTPTPVPEVFSQPVASSAPVNDADAVIPATPEPSDDEGEGDQGSSQGYAVRLDKGKGRALSDSTSFMEKAASGSDHSVTTTEPHESSKQSQSSHGSRAGSPPFVLAPASSPLHASQSSPFAAHLPNATQPQTSQPLHDSPNSIRSSRSSAPSPKPK
ncbi:hypothetical protein T439DRAFT_176319 [Meredithblackwellia eburnea MCA 4105]